MSGTVLLIKRRCLFLRNFFIFYKLKVVKVGKRCTAILIVGGGWMWSGKAAIVYGMRYKRCRIKLKFSCLSWGNVLPAVTEKTTFFFRPNRETLSIKSCNYLLTNKIALGICLPGPALYPPYQRAVEPPWSKPKALCSPMVCKTLAPSAEVALWTIPI